MTDSAWDSYIEHVRIDQAELRSAVLELCRLFPPKAIARWAGLEPRTLYRFMRGEHTLRRDHFMALEAAIAPRQKAGG